MIISEFDLLQIFSNVPSSFGANYAQVEKPSKPSKKPTTVTKKKRRKRPLKKVRRPVKKPVLASAGIFSGVKRGFWNTVKFMYNGARNVMLGKSKYPQGALK